MLLTTQDWVVVVLYVIALIVIGVLASRRVADSGEYFLGKRRFGKLLMIAQNFGVGTHAEMPVSLAGAVYSTGISAIWYQWKNIFATPFYWVMAPVFRRVRRTTTAEMMEDRYGAGMSGLYTLFAFAFFTINIASMMKGAAKVLHEVLGTHFGVNQIVLGLATIFILYSFVGGLLASAWSDCLQGFLIIVLSFMLIPLGWALVGGLDGMKVSLPAQNFSLATPAKIGPWFIAMLTINGLIGIMAQPHIMATVGTGKDERTCRVGFFHGNYVKRLCTVGWAIVGLMVAAMVSRGLFGVHALNDPEEAFGFACRHLLAPGFRGLLVASVMGACLASCSALMIASGALFTQGFYRPRLFPNKSDSHYLWVGRLSGLMTVLIAIVYSLLLIEKVLYSFLLTETLATYMGITIVLGLVWTRANRWGAASALIVAIVTNFLMYHLKHERLDSWDPNIFLAALSAGIVSLVGVSLITRPEPEGRLATFFTRLKTPTDLGTDEVSLQNFPETEEKIKSLQSRDSDLSLWAAQNGRQSLLLNVLSLRDGIHGQGFFQAYREDLKGLIIGSGLSIGLVIGLWLLLRI